ncbi:16729_t:CDS:2, partial [Funneliformis caledonium]
SSILTLPSYHYLNNISAMHFDKSNLRVTEIQFQYKSLENEEAISINYLKHLQSNINDLKHFIEFHKIKATNCSDTSENIKRDQNDTIIASFQKSNESFPGITLPVAMNGLPLRTTTPIPQLLSNIPSYVQS